MQKNRPPLCIYHGNCADGFGSAWVVRKYFQDVMKESIEFHAGIYQNPPPDVTGREVLMVDFSYKRDVLLKMAQQATHIRIIDHHKSAEADLKNLDIEFLNTPASFEATFDMERSGAGLTWDTLFPDTNRPDLINYIEDRDLWRFKLGKSREVAAALFSYPYDFEVWDGLMRPFALEHLKNEGVAIDRKHFKDINELLGVTVRHMKIGGHIVPVANLPYTMGSDACDLMCTKNPAIPFSAYYYDTEGGRVFGMRSIEGGRDVSEVAKLYGGGGHKHAAGFRVSYADAAQFLPM